MTKTEQYCYDQGRGELKSVMNQLKECREEIDRLEKVNKARQQLCVAYRIGSHSVADKALTALEKLGE